MSLSEKIKQLRSEFLNELTLASTSKDLENLKVKFLGKKGPIPALMIELKNCSADDRPLLGKQINDLKEELISHCNLTESRLKDAEMLARFSSEAIDPTLPGRRQYLGRSHPLMQMMDRAIDILAGMGFSVRLGPEVDTDYYNFEGLNFAPDHPSRDMQDTFYLNTEWLLRTHTSNVQVRVMEEFAPPIRIIAPGRTFRNENISARSHVFFHQIEGLYIDRNVSFADLFATMDEFWSKLLGEKVQTRFRPSYFPFVEPGLEVDVRCTACRGKGCRLCKHSGWLEVCGAGMVHPNVLKKGNIDPEQYSGYAWGMGIERLTILQYDIPDIRMFTQNDIRFLSQFP
ncbi:MAG: pheS [Parachlamydiales bacterium]|nr:pheS [Parachlamydiales bacterium]